jgi:hypothetical protein
MPHHPLHTIEALAGLGSLDAAWMPQVVDGIQRLPVGVEQCGLDA